MIYTFNPRGVCSSEMKVELDENKVIQKLEVTGGCNGNLKAIGELLKGVPASEAVRKLKGIKCGFRNTSCADQLAVHLETYLQEIEADRK